MNNRNYIVICSWMINELKLKGNELIIFSCIYGFSQNGGSYTGSLNYLMMWSGTSKNTVLSALKSLEGRNLIIKTEYVKNNIKFCEYAVDLEFIENCMGGSKIEPNNIDSINSSINTNNKYKEDIDNIIIYLNSILGSNFALGTQKTRNLILKWLKLDYTVDDFKAVIDKKYKEWKDTEWEKYLRPETLFGGKFEGYLYTKVITKGDKSNNGAVELIGGYTVAELKEQGFTDAEIEAERRRLLMS